jgi:hypothetical protein
MMDTSHEYDVVFVAMDTSQIVQEHTWALILCEASLQWFVLLAWHFQMIYAMH